MKEIIVKEKSFRFAVRIINLYIYLKEKKEFTLSRQILRAGTSIGANIEEAARGVSKADFKNKICISYKEARETNYWLKLLKETKFINDTMFKSLEKDCDEIKKILYTTLKGLK